MAQKDILDEDFVFCRFEFSVLSKHKVKVKEIILKHNKEIKWIFKESTDRSEQGDRIAILELYCNNETLENINDKLGLFVGLIEDLFNINGGCIDEDLAEQYNLAISGIATKDEMSKYPHINLKKSKKDSIFLYRSLLNKNLTIIADLNKIIEAERKYPIIIRNIFGTLVQEWYEECIEKIEKIFINKKEFENTKLTIEKLEKSKIKKIPYKIKKFRI